MDRRRGLEPDRGGRPTPTDEIEGANLGWSGFEGREPYLDGDGRRPTDPVDPVFQYTHDDGNCSITGGLRTGGGDPSLQRRVPVRRLLQRPGARHPPRRRRRALVEHDLGVDVENPISFGTDADGEAYVLSAAGDIVRLTDAG
ncbi:MAG: hypothetical protein R2711_07155 [Acidimicrobiales bacterium]